MVEPIISLRFSFVLDPHAVLELVLYPLHLTGGVGWSGGLEGLGVCAPRLRKSEQPRFKFEINLGVAGAAAVAESP